MNMNMNMENKTKKTKKKNDTEAQVRFRQFIRKFGIRTRSKKVSRSMWGNFFMLVFLMIFGVFIVLPIAYMFINAFKPINELFLYPPRFFVRNPTLSNFSDMFNLIGAARVPFERYAFNSLLVAGVGTVGSVMLSALTAYPLAKHKFPGAALLLNIVVWAMLFRPDVTVIPLYLIIAKLHMLDNFLALILPAMAMSQGVFIMRQFMVASIPDALIEAAKIDGASEFKIFRSIVMPMVKPAWLTLTIIMFIQIWNQTGVQFIYTEQMKMLPQAMGQIATMGISRQGAGAAVGMFLIIPTIILFIFCQGSMLETMSTSGIK